MLHRDAVFVDTNGWIAILNADDGLHPKAFSLLTELGIKKRHLITTDWVFAETANGLARTPARHRFISAVQRFEKSPTCHLIQVDRILFDQSLNLYSQAEDKSWGLIDCASIIVMRNEGIVDAFTTDHHFTQAGFQCLLSRT
jgi:uncharacterized protein